MKGFRFRRSIRLAKGLRINLSKSGASLSVGRRGSTLNFGHKGEKVTFGIPGTGISYSRMLRRNPKDQTPQDHDNGPQNQSPKNLLGMVAWILTILFFAGGAYMFYIKS